MKRYLRKKNKKNSNASLPQAARYDDFLSWLGGEIITQIKEGYLLGIPVEDLAEEWEISEEDVIRILHIAGVKIKES